MRIYTKPTSTPAPARGLSDCGCPQCAAGRQPRGLSGCGCSGKTSYDGLMDGPKVPPEVVKTIIREESESALRSVNIVGLATSTDPIGQLTGVITTAVEKSVERVCTTGVEATLKDNWIWLSLGAAALIGVGYVLGK